MKHKLISFEDYAALEKALGSNVKYVDVKIGNVAFLSIELTESNITYTPHSQERSIIDVLLYFQNKEPK